MIRCGTIICKSPAESFNLTFRPYMPFPAFWPKFVPKDKLADWFETYAATLELNVWLSTTPQSFRYDDAAGKWTVNIERVRDGKKIQSESPLLSAWLTGQGPSIHAS